jgi:hypothetical protein
MKRIDQINPRLIAAFLLGMLLFNYPVLSLFNLPRLVLGVPVLYGYIFLVWGLLIVLMGISAESSAPPP